MKFDDPANIGKDVSGNGNDFTAYGFELADQTSPNYDPVNDSPTRNFAIINPLYPGASTSNANLTTANTTGKPSILGIAGNGWDGTEAGWTTTGDVDFGQRTATDEISTAQLPAAPIPNGRDHFQAITDTGANILTAAKTTFPNGLWWIKPRVLDGVVNVHQLIDSVTIADVGSDMTSISPRAVGGDGTGFRAYLTPTGGSPIACIAWCWNYNAANPQQNGFAINRYTGNGTGTQTHTLGAVPDMIIIGCRSTVTDTTTGMLFHFRRDGETRTYSRLSVTAALSDPASSGTGGILSADDTTITFTGSGANRSGCNETGNDYTM